MVMNIQISYVEKISQSAKKLHGAQGRSLRGTKLVSLISGRWHRC